MCAGDAALLGQICLAAAFPRGSEPAALGGYMTGEFSALCRNYPELPLCRDIVFLLKLLMVRFLLFSVCFFLSAHAAAAAAAALPRRAAFQAFLSAFRWRPPFPPFCVST